MFPLTNLSDIHVLLAFHFFEAFFELLNFLLVPFQHDFVGDKFVDMGLVFYLFAIQTEPAERERIRRIKREDWERKKRESVKRISEN